MWETIKTLYHATIEALSNRKGKKLVTHNQECKKKKIEGYMHFFSRHEICLSINYYIMQLSICEHTYI